MRITESEVLEALAAAAKGGAPKEAKTMLELIAQMGIGRDRISQALVQCRAEGRLVVHRAHRPAIDGTQRVVPAYAILPKRRKP